MTILLTIDQVPRRYYKQVNTDLPIILLDHRPTDIEKHASLPPDIQVSGHAHKGQIFPASLITKMMYRLDYGHEKIGNPHVFVTSGYGFWGIPMRLGSQSEVIIIDVKENKKERSKMTALFIIK